MKQNLPRPEYPRPQFRRADWLNLNGTWSFAFDFGNSGRDQGWEKSTGFDREIQVPFCPESRLSGVEYRDFIPAIFYHRVIAIPAAWQGRRILLHFGAVDAVCEAFVDGRSAGIHYGGTASFTFDLTALVRPGASHHLVVQARDDLRSGEFGGGKQSPNHHSYGCMYTRTTGIWQTVWLEAVAPCALRQVRIVPDFDNGVLTFTPQFYALEAGQRWSVSVQSETRIASAAADGVPLQVRLARPRSWSPEDPYLYDIVFEVHDAAGNCIDRVESYAGLRKISIAGNQIFLNNQPLFQRLVLDQGFYPDGIWTAPDDDALRRDIELSMAAGFNGARLHQKVFEERFHYWADRLGYLTWGESSSWGLEHRNPAAREGFLAEWSEIVERDANHPSIITWTPLNESCPPDDAGLRNFFRPGEWAAYQRWVIALYDLTKRLDPTRPVNDSSGYTHVKTDLWTVHPYRKDAADLAAALFPATVPVMMHAPEHECAAYHGQPFVVDEFGGFLYLPPEHGKFAADTWGYHGLELKNEDELCAKIVEQAALLRHDARVAGYCYTQLTDVEQEQNGVYNYDRTPKITPGKLVRYLRDAGVISDNQ